MKKPYFSGFSLLGGGWGRFPLPAKHLLTPTPTPPPLHQIFILPPPNVNLPPPPLTKQFSSYTPIKTAFLAVVIVPTPFLF